MKHEGNKHHARAQAFLSRHGYADGGGTDDDNGDRIPWQEQAAMGHIAARGGEAIHQRVTGVSSYTGDKTRASGFGKEDEDTFRAAFGEDAVKDEEAAATRERDNKYGYGRRRGGRS